MWKERDLWSPTNQRLIRQWQLFTFEFKKEGRSIILGLVLRVQTCVHEDLIAKISTLDWLRILWKTKEDENWLKQEGNLELSTELITLKYL